MNQRSDRTTHWVLSWTAKLGKPPTLLSSTPFGGIAPAIFRASSGNQVLFAGYAFVDTPQGNEPAGAPERVVAEAYEQGGIAAVAELSGGFVIAIWDRAEDALLLLRDAMGLVPCYYQTSASRVLISACSDALLQHSAIAPTPNRAMLAEWILSLTNPSQIEETYINEIRRLPPAHWIRFPAKGELTPYRYWDPLPPGFAWAQDLDVPAIANRIDAATQRCIAVGADSIALSGGYDSVVAAAFAASSGARQTPLQALSLRFSGTPMDEGALQVRVAEQLGFPHLMTEIDGIGDDGFVDRVLRHSESLPMPVVGLWQPMYSWLMESACEQGLKRVIFGTGGDEMFTVDTAFARDLAMTGRLSDLWCFLRAWQRTSPMSAVGVARYILWSTVTKPVLHGAARELLRATPFELPPGAAEKMVRALLPAGPLAEEVRGRIVASAPARDMPGYQSYVTVLRDLVQSPLLMLELDQGAAWMARYEITGLYPYFDRELVELVLRAPAPFLYANGQMKAPLREIATRMLPGFNKTDKKVDFGDMVRQLIRRSGQRSWDHLGGARQLADLGVLDADKTNDYMQRFFDSDIGSTHVAWRIMSTEAWARRPELHSNRSERS